MREASRIAGLTPAQGDGLMSPERSVAVQFPVTMDDGTVRRLDGWRIVHSTARGPGKGGMLRAWAGRGTLSAMIEFKKRNRTLQPVATRTRRSAFGQAPP